ncbi:tryptophan halogenase family protein [Bdellovibrio bacteriovorus]|uniref:tryptophan halogenase family protein n=1 Tax=Bdellovibrio bacteriovorus TaxID=959 RepID=UPI0035A60FCB
MKTLSEHIENAFDLSYLNFPKCPPTDIKTIGILGGGTAGYLAALALAKYHPEVEVTVIESSKIPVIGVGESTTTEIVPFLHRGLEIDPVEFFREVEPTLKFGIHFEWGCPGDYKFNFSFFAGHQYESYYYENDIKNSNWPSVLMNANKIPVIRNKNGSLTSFLPSIPFSYHIDNKNLIRFLNKEVKSRGIEIVDAEVHEAKLDAQGNVASLESKEGHSLSYDLYIDCSGFRSKLLGQTLKTEFMPFTDTLITDRALTFDLPNKDVVECYTSVITMNNGWCWKIPMRTEDHYGYVFSSKFCDEEAALAEARARFGHFEKYKMVEFRSGRHKQAWVKNVFSLGNAYGFIEPLESTAIQTAVHSINVLCRLMPKSLEDQISINGINNEIAVTWDTFRWFVGMHYKFNKKLDTPFWKHCREKTNIGNAQTVVDLFNQRPPLSAGNFGSNSQFTATEALVFNSYSYDTLIFGQKEVHKPLTAPEMSKEEYFSKLKSYEELTSRSLSLFELFKGDHLMEDGILEQLFNDTDTWIMEADV